VGNHGVGTITLITGNFHLTDFSLLESYSQSLSEQVWISAFTVMSPCFITDFITFKRCLSPYWMQYRLSFSPRFVSGSGSTDQLEI